MMDGNREHKTFGERLGVDHTLQPGEVLGAIDVGSNAARLKLCRVLADGSFERLHMERDPIRPGEGLWQTGEMQKPVVQRLTRTLKRYAAICEEAGVGHLRAVATSALREARNRDEVVERVRKDSGIELEVVSGKEEARLIALGVLRGMPHTSRTLLLDIGGGSTEVARAVGEEPLEVWSAPIGAVRLTELFQLGDDITREQLTSMRHYAQRVLAETLPKRIIGAPPHALGSSGTIRAVSTFAAAPGRAHATRDDLSRCVEELVQLGAPGRRKRFEVQRAEIVVAGAIILEALAHQLRVASVTAVDGGLKEGILVDLVRRARQRRVDPLLSEALLVSGRRFSFDEPHALHTRDVGFALFDQLAPLHRLPADARLIFEVAAMLHDVGNVVSRSRHHKHSLYLIRHMDLPGLSEHERDLAALVARFHRRSHPKRSHPDLIALTDVERRLVRVLAVLLRIADGSDRSRNGAVASVESLIQKKRVVVRFKARPKKQIEAWDVEQDAERFERVFGLPLEIQLG